MIVAGWQVADTGTSVIILPVNIARRNGVTWTAVDPDEPGYVGVTGVELDILGQANICTVFDNIKGGHNLQILVARQEAEEILVDPHRPQYSSSRLSITTRSDDEIRKVQTSQRNTSPD